MLRNNDKERVVIGSMTKPIFSSNLMAGINRENDDHFNIEF